MAKKNSLTEAPYQKRLTYRIDGVEFNEPQFVRWELASYVQYGEYEWRPNKPFTASLEMEGFGRGRSSTVFNWVDPATGTMYPMFVSSLAVLLKSEVLIHGKTDLIPWIVVKKGANYGVERYEE